MKNEIFLSFPQQKFKPQIQFSKIHTKKAKSFRERNRGKEEERERVLNLSSLLHFQVNLSLNFHYFLLFDYQWRSRRATTIGGVGMCRDFNLGSRRSMKSIRDRRRWLDGTRSQPPQFQPVHRIQSYLNTLSTLSY